MRRRPKAVLIAVAICAGAGGSAATPAVAPATPAALPPDLVTLLAKMEALPVSSLRFSFTTHTALHGVHVTRELLKFEQLFEFGFSGEAVTSPPAASFQLTLFGAHLYLRAVNGVTFLYSAAVGRRDHGRPWIDLGRAGLGAIFKVPGAHKAPPERAMPLTAPGASGFKTLAATVRGATAVAELGPAVVDGQAVMDFSASLPSEGRRGGDPLGGALVSANPTAALAPAIREGPSTESLVVSITPAGVPVRTLIVLQAGQATDSGELDFPAINFPLTIAAPPARETITLSAARKLEHRRSETRSRSKQ